MTEPQPGSADRTPLFTLLTANALSQVGNAGTGLAVPWFILQTTGSAAKTGLAAAAIGIGRRAWFRTMSPKGGGGSSPLDRTTFQPRRTLARRGSFVSEIATGAAERVLVLLAITRKTSAKTRSPAATTLAPDPENT